MNEIQLKQASYYFKDLVIHVRGKKKNLIRVFT